MPSPKEDPLHWLDVDDIGEALAEAHPGKDAVRISFTQLKALVLALPNFREQPGHPCNEKILEHIQGAWIEARDGSLPDEED